jgi:hypothetical protein
MVDLVRIRGVSAEPPDRINTLQQVLSEGGKRIFDIAPNILKEIIGEHEWVGRCDSAGVEFKSFEAFAACPLWEGLGCTIADLMAICRKREDVQKRINEEIGAAPKHVGRGHRSDNVTPNRGNNPTYALKRLKRDRPDLAEKVIAGELSTNAAAIEAGFRKPPSPLKQLRKAWAKASLDERTAFRAEIEHG